MSPDTQPFNPQPPVSTIPATCQMPHDLQTRSFQEIKLPLNSPTNPTKYLSNQAAHFNIPVKAPNNNEHNTAMRRIAEIQCCGDGLVN